MYLCIDICCSPTFPGPLVIQICGRRWVRIALQIALGLGLVIFLHFTRIPFFKPEGFESGEWCPCCGYIRVKYLMYWCDILYIHQSKSRRHRYSYHILVYISPVLNHLLGTVSHVLWPSGMLFSNVSSRAAISEIQERMVSVPARRMNESSLPGS